MRPTNRLLGFVYDCLQLAGWFSGALRQTFRGRLVKHLESENARLIAENRALWQAVARTRGVAIDLPNEITTTPTRHPGARTNGAPDTSVKSPGANTPRGRHESWPQRQARLSRQSVEHLRKEAELEVAANLSHVAPAASNGASQTPPPAGDEAHGN